MNQTSVLLQRYYKIFSLTYLAGKILILLLTIFGMHINVGLVFMAIVAAALTASKKFFEDNDRKPNAEEKAQLVWGCFFLANGIDLSFIALSFIAGMITGEDMTAYWRQKFTAMPMYIWVITFSIALLVEFLILTTIFRTEKVQKSKKEIVPKPEKETAPKKIKGFGRKEIYTTIKQDKTKDGAFKKIAVFISITAVVFIAYWQILFFGFSQCTAESGLSRVFSAKGAEYKPFSINPAVHKTPKQEFPAEVMELPDIDGTGDLPSLRSAIAQDYETGSRKLYTAVKKLHDKELGELFKADKSVLNEVREIALLWSGTDQIDPYSRGYFINAQDISATEKALGTKFYQLGVYANPAPASASIVKLAFNGLINAYYSFLLLQSGGKQLFKNNSFDYEALNLVTEQASLLPTTEEKAMYWQNVARMAMPDGDISRFPIGMQQSLENAIKKSDASLTLAEVLQGLTPPSEMETKKITDPDGKQVNFRFFGLSKLFRYSCVK